MKMKKVTALFCALSLLITPVVPTYAAEEVMLSDLEAVTSEEDMTSDQEDVISEGQEAVTSDNLEADVSNEETNRLVPDVGWWKFDEAEGDVAVDTTGNNDGVIKGDATRTEGISGGALDLDGSGDFVLIPSYTKPANQCTYSIWLYKDEHQTGLKSILKNWGHRYKEGQLNLFFENGTSIVAIVRKSNNQEVKLVSQNYEFPLKEWILVSLVADGEDIILYANETEIGRIGYDGTLLSDSASNIAPALGIGAKPNDDGTDVAPSNADYFKGKIDDVRIYSYALSQEELTALYEAEIPASIEVTTMPIKTTYKVYEDLDLTGMEVTATCLDGTTTKVLSSSDYQVDGYDSQEPGEQTITVSYMGMTTTFKVIVEARQVQNVKFTRTPKRQIYGPGSDLSLVGLQATVTFKDGFMQVLTSDMMHVEIDGYDKNKVGTQKVTLSTELFGQKIQTKYSVTVKTPDLPLQVREVNEWTALLDRDEEGWHQADGIYTIPLNCNDAIGSATEASKTLFIYSDTNFGTKNQSDNSIKRSCMYNHSAGVLSGNSPVYENYQPVYGENGNMTYSNMFKCPDSSCPIEWLFDGVAVGNTVYIIGMDEVAWNADTLHMIKVPIVNGEPDFANYSVTPKIPLKTDSGSVIFGTGIMANTEEAGAPNPDGYIYVYGYRPGRGSRMVVSRVLREDLIAENYENWQFWTGYEWSNNIEDSNCNEAEICPVAVSNECSVTPITTGPYAGKYMLVYCRGSQSPTMEYSIGNTPMGPFEETVPFYYAPDEDVYYNKRAYTYNCKAHPSLSREGHLLISYNENLYDPQNDADDYRPRFIELDLEHLADEPVLGSVSAFVPIESSNGSNDATTIVDGNRGEWKASTSDEKWIEMDLGQSYYLSMYKMRCTDDWRRNDLNEILSGWIVKVSNDKQNWITVDEVENNTSNFVKRDFDQELARYVRVEFTDPNQTDDDSWVVLNHMMVFGTSKPVKLDTRVNVALGKPVTASGSQAQAGKLVDGQYSNMDNDKWCCVDSGDKWITVDLEKEYTIGRYVLRNAGVAEATRYNTSDYKLQASSDGTTWTDIDTVKENWMTTVDKEVDPFTAQYVRLYVTKPARSNDDATRIYELELYAEADELIDDVDKSALEKLYQKNLGKNESDYTEDSWYTFAEAMKHAEEVLDDENATQSQVDETLNKLKKASSGLKKAKKAGKS